MTFFNANNLKSDNNEKISHFFADFCNNCFKGKFMSQIETRLL